jgi:hypothetical protein
MILWLSIGLQVKTKGKKAMFDKAMELDNKSALDSPHYTRVTSTMIGSKKKHWAACWEC